MSISYTQSDFVVYSGRSASRQCQEFPALVRLGAALSGGVPGDSPGCPRVRQVLYP